MNFEQIQWNKVFCRMYGLAVIEIMTLQEICQILMRWQYCFEYSSCNFEFEFDFDIDFVNFNVHSFNSSMFFKSLGLYNNISPKFLGMVPVQCAMTMYEVRPEALLSVIPSLKTVPAWTFQPIQPIKGQKGQLNWPYTTVHSFNLVLKTN